MTKTDFNVSCVWQANALLGEGPIWSKRHSGLFWVDVKRPTLFFFNPNENVRSVWPLPKMVGCVAASQSGALIAALEDGIYRLTIGAPGEMPKLQLVAAPTNHSEHMRFNDGKYAPDGSFWAGTMDNREIEANGAWYRLTPHGDLQRKAEHFLVTNGPAFDPSRDCMYLNDSALRTTYKSTNQDAATLDLQVFREFSEAEGYPDGMTVGADGTLWIAFWDGGCIRGIHPDTAETLCEIEMPVARPTSCTFGGPNSDTLYVTSASIGIDVSNGKPENEFAGSLFEIAGPFAHSLGTR